MKPVDTDDPLEVGLVFNVRPCGTCTFFWPDDPSNQPYGPFPAYDFDSNTPTGKTPDGRPVSYPWLKGTTRDQAFPNGEVMDGCRKAPIMTIGINPNLTAFSPGITGTSWVYPNFSSNNGTDAWTKYAYYYRYRSIYQERLDFDVVKQYLLDDGKIVAEKDGYIASATRTSSAPSFDLIVRYTGESKDTVIPLDRDLGEPRYVLLFDRHELNNQFKKGDVIAAKLQIPEGKKLEIYQQLQTYYEQFVPTLDLFQSFLKAQGHDDADLHMGEDVCQIDMVACASPHWNSAYLGGTSTSENHIIENCVSINAWAMKQFVQTRPAILYLVGESSYSMFRQAFGGLIKRDPPLSQHPDDGAFTLFRETTDPDHPCTFEFSTTINSRKYTLSTRLVVTPHFSYDTNYLPQFRLSKNGLKALMKEYPNCYTFLTTDSRIALQKADWGYDAFLIQSDAQGVLDELKQHDAGCWQDLKSSYYDPHQTMYAILEDLYKAGSLGYQDGTNGKPGYLARTEGSCRFCVNSHWEFPLGCPYGKIEEKTPPKGFLTAVAAQIVQEGKPA